MAALAQTVRGELLSHKKSDSEISGALIIDPARGKVFLRYALVRLGTDDLVFPELVLDDWGHERKNLLLYRWIYENGYQFPRAELFGYDFHGGEQQHFLRELDLQSRYPCFGYTGRYAPLNEGIEMSFIVNVRDESPQAEPLKDKSEFDWPIRNAAVEWWQAPPDIALEFGDSLVKGRGTTVIE